MGGSEAECRYFAHAMQDVEGGVSSPTSLLLLLLLQQIPSSMPMPYVIICMLHADTKIIAATMQMNLVT